MLPQIAYVRQQILLAQRASTPIARADHLQRALDGIDRAEAQAKAFAVDVILGNAGIDEDDMLPDPFLPMGKADEVSLTEEDVKGMGEAAIAEMIERAR